MLLKKICLSSLACLLLFSACAGTPELIPPVTEIESETEKHFFNTFPTEGGLVFIGAAARRRDPRDTLQFALEDAARRVSVFRQVSGEYAIENNVGSGAFDFSHDTFMSLRFDLDATSRYINYLTFNLETDTLEIDNTFFIRTVYPGTLPSPVRFHVTYSGENRRPSWIESPPRNIEGFEVGVGFSNRFASVANTYTNSFNNAIFAIIRNILTVTQSREMLYRHHNDLFGFRTTRDNIVYSFGTLRYFYVLDTWVDPADRTVWTLAIARIAE